MYFEFSYITFTFTLVVHYKIDCAPLKNSQKMDNGPFNFMTILRRVEECLFLYISHVHICCALCVLLFNVVKANFKFRIERDC